MHLTRSQEMQEKKMNKTNEYNIIFSLNTRNNKIFIVDRETNF